jgi:hypothetical protein
MISYRVVYYIVRRVLECINPSGYGRGNHTQDQSVLTYLIHKNQIVMHGTHEAAAGRDDGYAWKCDRTIYSYLPTYPSLETYTYMCLF